MNTETAWKLNPEEKQTIDAAVRRWAPAAVRWLTSNHDAEWLRTVAKAARWAMMAAGMSDVGGAALNDKGLADVADAVLIALPVIMEVLSHWRNNITAWIDRRWPSPSTDPRDRVENCRTCGEFRECNHVCASALPAVADIRPPVPETRKEDADVPAYQAMGEMKHP